MPSSVSLKLGIDYDSSEEQSSDQSRASSLEKSPKNSKKWEIQTENGMSKNNRRDSDKLQKSRQKMREKSENLFEIKLQLNRTKVWIPWKIEAKLINMYIWTKSN